MDGTDDFNDKTYNNEGYTDDISDRLPLIPGDDTNINTDIDETSFGGTDTLNHSKIIDKLYDGLKEVDLTALRNKLGLSGDNTDIDLNRFRYREN